MAASSCVGGDSGVRREVEIRGAQLTDFLDWSVGVKGADFICGPAFICAVKNWVTMESESVCRNSGAFVEFKLFSVCMLWCNVCITEGIKEPGSFFFF